MMQLHEIVEQEAVVFLDKETDILISWDGGIKFEIFSGRFDGHYDNIDSFYREVKSVSAAREAANMWFREHGTFNPGP